MADEKMVQDAVKPQGNGEEADDNAMETNEEVEDCDDQGTRIFLPSARLLSGQKSRNYIIVSHLDRLTYTLNHRIVLCIIKNYKIMLFAQKRNRQLDSRVLTKISPCHRLIAM